MLNQLKTWARGIKRDVVAVYYAARDPRTPTVARILAALVAAYALSPIDLIPDFIPILGYLDDLIIVPLGLLWVKRLLPPVVLDDCRAKAEAAIFERKDGRPWGLSTLTLPGVMPNGWPLGMAVKADNKDLATALDKALSGLRESGELLQIFRSHGLTLAAP